MKADLVDDMNFEEHDTLGGLTGAIPVLRQIVNEKDPVMGWMPDVVYQDVGHWSGEHPNCIKTKEHEQYYREVGREITWQAT